MPTDTNTQAHAHIRAHAHTHTQLETWCEERADAREHGPSDTGMSEAKVSGLELLGGGGLSAFLEMDLVYPNTSLWSGSG